jgi:hypothetical protein
LARKKTLISFFLRRIIFLFLIASRVFSSLHLSPWPMQVDHVWISAPRWRNEVAAALAAVRISL